jgi:hypothetical protein
LRREENYAENGIASYILRCLPPRQHASDLQYLILDRPRLLAVVLKLAVVLFGKMEILRIEWIASQAFGYGVRIFEFGVR